MFKKVLNICIFVYQYTYIQRERRRDTQAHKQMQEETFACGGSPPRTLEISAMES